MSHVSKIPPPLPPRLVSAQVSPRSTQQRFIVGTVLTKDSMCSKDKYKPVPLDNHGKVTPTT